MEDEEGYMALNMQPRKEQTPNPRSQEAEILPRHRRLCEIVTGAGCAVMLLMAGAAIALRISAFQRQQYMDDPEKSFVSGELGNGTENKSSLEEVLTRLRQFLCKPLHTNFTESFGCKLCPANWFRHENKCYWISEEKGTWKKGQEDCTARHSHLLVLQKQEEVAFIQSIAGETQLLWIGLVATLPERRWTWVDGSPLDKKRLQKLGPVEAEADSCGMLYGHEVITAACNTIIAWVCETEALNISDN